MQLSVVNVNDFRLIASNNWIQFKSSILLGFIKEDLEKLKFFFKKNSLFIYILKSNIWNTIWVPVCLELYKLS